MAMQKIAVFRGPQGWKVITPNGEILLFNNMVRAMQEAYEIANGEELDLEAALTSL